MLIFVFPRLSYCMLEICAPIRCTPQTSSHVGMWGVILCRGVLPSAVHCDQCSLLCFWYTYNLILITVFLNCLHAISGTWHTVLKTFHPLTQKTWTNATERTQFLLHIQISVLKHTFHTISKKFNISFSTVEQLHQ